MKLIVGLGNPGKKYEDTRHNVGFHVIDQCAKNLNITLNQEKWKGLFGYETIGGEKVFLLKPLTYMNLSGEAVRPLIDFYKIEIDNVLVVYDDLDLPPGKIRLRQKGGHGGHNGIKSMLAHLGTENFKRIRVGIGRPEPGIAVANYVLSTFPPSEKQDVHESVQHAANACESWLSKDFLNVMNSFN
ncbi:aminoacyl-tRNA hydrolase [Anaerobacillus alkalidiazotrophicus]|uniref:Peptidyl-tRNA hydrolase n=1 Tax=Anaerobacillus alkalidiazotrophicus TaxID=472963 RepID=A0A1S2M728_9BACI|nr:aminoacyl-tRNA hydrolase [Anaerobacillus alkalidiazotrophicus]OIJ20521.1 aminoacyl-tRNA hydrolase [Anaerobacillus alkalidiazotrophicus]